ncbi:valyl-tRNA synthetase [compost metagenome]
MEAERERILGKLANEKFVANAKPELVEAERERLVELDLQKESLSVALTRVAEAG